METFPRAILRGDPVAVTGSVLPEGDAGRTNRLEGERRIMRPRALP
ncbi:hypothetical protein D187_003599 [Cystobacter fuscus DSM 2262]|uniref:Uncharacterized protein n=1 Tax=Cystobacter fuscus (strain ATCC 25194 / DSM 2262 / NBRC 100088 / M29) TaxID=1242864 RepID=S9QC22_CYSF2|nr:hypothetical protein [Cystobacter fuscus]EPX58884.1 hypothetical protein D187_003599 [Cystobacter fuscus DSM 2262]